MFTLHRVLFAGLVFACVISFTAAQEPALPKLRVLLMAGGPVRDYQFLRTVLAREVMEKRMEVADLLHTGRDKNAATDDGIELLTEFPDQLGGAAAKKLGMNLADYDVVIAFDPDWSKLSAKQQGLLHNWVRDYGGGFIFVAGRAHTHLLARSGKELDNLLPLIPVVLMDNRLHEKKFTGPYMLKFADKMKPKLDDKQDGWKRFFGEVEIGTDLIPRPQRGFYDCYPVERSKPGTIVLATFAINDGKGNDPPYLAVMPYASGKTMYLGSAETWRLRTVEAEYHQRLWIGLARYAAAGRESIKRDKQ